MKKKLLLISLFVVSISYGQLKSLKANGFTVSGCTAGGKTTVSYPTYFTGATSGYAGSSNTSNWELNMNLEELPKNWIQAEVIFENNIPSPTSMDDMLSISSNDFTLTAYAHNATGNTLTGCNFAGGQVNKIRFNLEYNGTYVNGTDVELNITTQDPVSGVSETINVTVSPNESTASIDKLKKYDFNFGPNPTEHSIYLSAAKSIGNVEVFNLVGQKFLSTDMRDTKGTLDISNLSKGVYIMNVTIDQNVGTYKIIKE